MNHKTLKLILFTLILSAVTTGWILIHLIVKNRLLILSPEFIGIVLILLFQLAALTLLIRQWFFNKNQIIPDSNRSVEQRLLLDVIDAGLNEIYIFDAETLKFKYVSPRAHRNTGHIEGDFNVMTPLDLKPSYDERSFRALLKPLLMCEKEKLTFQTVHRRSDKSLYPVEVHLKLIERRGERLFLAVVQDITDRKLVEDSMRLTAKVYESAGEAIMITDVEGTILDINNAFTKITGYTSKEVVGKTPRILKSGKHSQDFYKALWYSLLTTGKWQGEIIDRRKNGEIYPKTLKINELRNEKGERTHYVAIFSDISTSKRNEELAEYLAYHDTLTGLPNRILFHDLFQQILVQAESDDEMVGLIFLDLDRFKNINDTMGHSAGDQLLVEVTQRLRNCLYETDTVARLGGDEFTIIIRKLSNEDTHYVTQVANKIIGTFSRPFKLNNRDIYITASIGITLYPKDGHKIEELLKNADIAMYYAKGVGKNNYQYYSTNLSLQKSDQLYMESDLRRALKQEEFLLHYQPQISFKTGKVSGLEVLVRWQPQSKDLIPPGQFIPLAEETGLITAIDEWVLRAACDQGKIWQDAGLYIPRLSVNLSGRQFSRKSLVETIEKILEETGFHPTFLELEITESSIMQNLDDGIHTLNRLRKLGICIAIDDFGTGYSSLNYLKRLPIDTLKIDQSFIRDMISDSSNTAIVTAIITMGQNLNMKVLAEGVELKSHADFLQEYHCDEAQGYYYSRPLPSGDVPDFLLNYQTANSL